MIRTIAAAAGISLAAIATPALAASSPAPVTVLSAQVQGACMAAHGKHSVIAEQCDPANGRQDWVMFANGTIQTMYHQCLTAGRRVLVLRCDGKSRQHWTLTASDYDGFTIRDPAGNYVDAVSDGAPVRLRAHGGTWFLTQVGG